MLQDRLGRPFKVGQGVVFLQEGLADAVITRIEEESVLKNTNAPPIHKIVVEIVFQFPIPPGANVRVSNISIAKEPEPGLSVVGSVKH
jgi:hypothetical protein